MKSRVCRSHSTRAGLSSSTKSVLVRGIRPLALFGRMSWVTSSALFASFAVLGNRLAGSNSLLRAASSSASSLSVSLMVSFRHMGCEPHYALKTKEGWPKPPLLLLVSTVVDDVPDDALDLRLSEPELFAPQTDRRVPVRVVRRVHLGSDCVEPLVARPDLCRRCQLSSQAIMNDDSLVVVQAVRSASCESRIVPDLLRLGEQPVQRHRQGADVAHVPPLGCVVVHDSSAPDVDARHDPVVILQVVEPSLGVPPCSRDLVEQVVAVAALAGLSQCRRQLQDLSGLDATVLAVDVDAHERNRPHHEREGLAELHEGVHRALSAEPACVTVGDEVIGSPSRLGESS